MSFPGRKRRAHGATVLGCTRILTWPLIAWNGRADELTKRNRPQGSRHLAAYPGPGGVAVRHARLPALLREAGPGDSEEGADQAAHLSDLRQPGDRDEGDGPGRRV